MKLNQRRQFAQVALFSLMALGAGSAFAQTERPAPGLPSPSGQAGIKMEAAGEKPTDPRGGPCHCSNPVNVHIVKNSGSTSPVASDFRSDMRLNESPYNGTVVNKFFTDTIQWKVPTSKTCELKGQVTIKLKNLGSSLSNNDTASVMVGGQAVPGMSLGPGALWTSSTAGQLRTLNYQLTTQMMLSGKLSFVTQDDTAVQEISVHIEGCCITPTR